MSTCQIFFTNTKIQNKNIKTYSVNKIGQNQYLCLLLNLPVCEGGSDQTNYFFMRLFNFSTYTVSDCAPCSNQM